MDNFTNALTDCLCNEETQRGLHETSGCSETDTFVRMTSSAVAEKPRDDLHRLLLWTAIQSRIDTIYIVKMAEHRAASLRQLSVLLIFGFCWIWKILRQTVDRPRTKCRVLKMARNMKSKSIDVSIASVVGLHVINNLYPKWPKTGSQKFFDSYFQSSGADLKSEGQNFFSREATRICLPTVKTVALPLLLDNTERRSGEKLLEVCVL